MKTETLDSNGATPVVLFYPNILGCMTDYLKFEILFPLASYAWIFAPF
jgi:hypothetical protein